MKIYEGKENWYYYEFNSNIKNAKIIFKDSNGNQIPNQGIDAENITKTAWFFSDYSYVTDDPFIESKPIININSSGGEFYNNVEINVKILSNSEITEMYYYINDEKFTLNSINEKIIYGINLDIGDKFTFKVVAINNIGKTESEKIIFYKDEYEVLEKIGAFNELRIYQIMVPTYIDGIVGGYGTGYGPSHHNGDLEGVINALDYIEDLGMNAIWMTPIFHSKSGELKGQSTGYYADDYYNVDPKFGSNEKLKELITKAHNKGIYIFLDGVFGHHGSNKIDGVKDGAKQWYGSEVIYPDSLAYFEDVAEYWIKEYEIDGWRLDQAYQLFQNKKNYWKYIRKKVENISKERKNSGKEWGTLGYMVGEIWDGGGDIINNEGYSQNGLRSCFDFPMRYSLVQVLATQEKLGESHGMNQPVSKLNNTFNSVNDNYPSYAQPNMFMSNHDLVRFGDLIQRAKKNEYWERHKLAISFLTAYTGPITLYYGDEYGDEVKGFVNEKDLGYYDDHVSRTSGRINNFNELEIDLINYTKNLMKIRKNNSALWNGERKNIYAEKYLYADLKIDGNNKIIYVMNVSNEKSERLNQKISNISINSLTDLETNEVITVKENTIDITIEPMKAKFFLIN